jgi:iron complex outermembrane receptor protein
VELPTGTVSAAAGGQYRIQSLNYIPDSLTAAGLANSPATDAPFSGSEHVWSEYAEAVVPFYKLATIQAAVRHEDYGGGIGSSTNPKITGRLNVVPDAVALRASWGSAFQAPTLSQDATSTIIATVNDPVVSTGGNLGCSNSTAGTGVPVVTSGGNLKPQTSTNYDLGLDLKPISDLTFSGDYWHYRYSNLIAAGQNAQAIVNGECVKGVFVEDPRVLRGAAGNLASVYTAFVNVGKVIADGFDLSSTYGLSLNRFGNLSIRGDATFVNSFDIYNANGSITQAAGSRNFNNNFAPMPKWRGGAHVAWSQTINQVALGVNYIGGYHNDQSNNGPVGSFTTVDLQYALNFPHLLRNDSPTTVLVGVNNIGNAAPPALNRYSTAGVPIVGSASVDRPGYDPLSGVDIRGRIIYARFSQKF